MWNSTLGLFLEAPTLLPLLCACICVFFLKTWAHTNNRKLPPGPPALPIIGHLHLLTHLPPHRAFAKLCATYGDYFSVKLGQKQCVVVSSPDLAREFLIKHDKAFNSRPAYRFVSFLFYGPPNDLFFSAYSASFRNMRKFCTLTLLTAKRLQELEYVRQDEVEFLLHRVAQKSEGGTKAVDIGRLVNEMSENIICRLLFSRPRKTMDQVEAEGGDSFSWLLKDMEHQCAPSVGDLFPWLAWLDVARKRSMRKTHRRLDDYINAILAGRKQEIMQNVAPKDDLLNALLACHVGEDRQDEEGFTTIEMKGIIMDFLAASIHTTGLTLEWAMGELLNNPNCLAKLQEEVDMVMGAEGKTRRVRDADVSRLSYLRSVVREVLRLHPAVPLLQRYNSSGEACEVGGYKLPPNTEVLVNVWGMGRDERVWPNGQRFDPQRFMAGGGKADIDVKGHHFELLPFGAGRRICMGLALGLTVVEVTLANLVDAFNWELPAGTRSVTMEEKPGISLMRTTPVLAFPKTRL